MYLRFYLLWTPVNSRPALRLTAVPLSTRKPPKTSSVYARAAVVLQVAAVAAFVPL